MKLLDSPETVNGYPVVASRPYGDRVPSGSARVVLCDAMRDNGYQEWITWVVNEHGAAFWGHYYDGSTDAGYDAAYADYLTR